MRVTTLATAALLAFVVPAATHAFDLTFLDQAPLRFFNDADIERMSGAVNQALKEASDGEEVQWQNDQTGSSGAITPVKSFKRQGKDCRRLKVLSQAKRASPGSATSNVDFCEVEGTWKILAIAR